MTTDDTLPGIPANSQRPGGWRWFLVYVVLALVIEWPITCALTTHIAYGYEREISVPMLNLWTVWWNADRAANRFRGYWNAPIFSPTNTTFVFSEAQPTSIIVAPLIGLTGNRGLAYNVYQLLILTLNGYSAHRLFRRLGHISWLAFCGGLMSQLLPFVMWQFGVVQLTTLAGIYWTLHAMLDLFGAGQLRTAHEPVDVPCDEDVAEPGTEASPSGRWQPYGIRLGLAYGVTYWLCNYWGLFLTLLLVPCSVCFWNRRLLTRELWREVVVAGTIAIVMIGPFAWSQRALSREHDWQSSRTSELIHSLSAHWRDHTDVPWYTLAAWLEMPVPERNNIWSLGGGGIKLVLAPLGLVAAVTTPRRRRWGLFSALFGALAFGLSLGPTVCFSQGIPVIGDVCPYELLQQFVPGFSLIRSPFRFALFVQLATVWLSVEALDLLNPQRWLTWRPVDSASPLAQLLATLDPALRRNRSDGRYLPISIAMVMVSTAVTLEALPPPTRMFELPSRRGLPVWVVWLRDQAAPDAPVACLPFPVGYQVSDYEETTIWMYWSTFHRHPLLNGYSGFFPDSFVQLKEGLELDPSPIDDEQDNDGINPGPQFARYASDNRGLQLLNASHARYIVVKRSFAHQDDIWTHPATRFRWALVASDEAEMIDIYELPPRNERDSK
jgi:hypothetical protein